MILALKNKAKLNNYTKMGLSKFMKSIFGESANKTALKPDRLDSTPSNEDGYFYYGMVGMYNIGIKPSDFGIFKGYAVAETNNPYDKYAVGVRRKGDDKLVGYAPREFQGKSNELLHREILEKGGMVDVVFKISGNAQGAFGAMYIKWR